jgi:hypothetical protein
MNSREWGAALELPMEVVGCKMTALRVNGCKMPGITVFAASLLVATFAPANHAHPRWVSCTTAGTCRPAPSSTVVPSLLVAATELELDYLNRRERLQRGTPLSAKEFASFSGIGAIVCQANAARRTATAFLVGRFDIAVTVGHTFKSNDSWIAPTHCSYMVTGPKGRILERIPLASVKTQWASEPTVSGHPATDVAVVRLSRPAQFPRSTLPFSKFAHTSAPVKMIGFEADFGANTVKRKLHGTLYTRRAGDCVRFAHDIDTRGATSGEPLIDRRDNIVIGIHLRLRPADSSSCKSRGNAMIPMNDWLERTLREEISAIPQTAHD